MPNEVAVGAASLSISQSVTAFMSFLPSLSEVRKADAKKNPDMVGDVRLGEVAAVTLTIGVGTIVSSLTGSPIPAFVSALMCAILVTLYETALRGNRIGEPKTFVRSTDAVD